MGFEFVRQYAERGWRVIATARQPDAAEDLQVLARRFSNVVIERLDVTVEEQILALSLKYANEPIDVLINNAGIKGARTQLSAS